MFSFRDTNFDEPLAESYSTWLSSFFSSSSSSFYYPCCTSCFFLFFSLLFVCSFFLHVLRLPMPDFAYFAVGARILKRRSHRIITYARFKPLPPSRVPATLAVSPPPLFSSSLSTRHLDLFLLLCCLHLFLLPWLLQGFLFFLFFLSLFLSLLLLNLLHVFLSLFYFLFRHTLLRVSANCAYR